ncbi:hypothetical protein GOP47_0005567 [Adiantum capillus-veneris]|uniref:non-specific serine/threonine protein kinase n=1 Tax=Adiantum capillus-veneris TaxID=13818 RepID=A0A9D4V6I3_ADICA|nr:hypothetical protein GOP47_0005567 [Adiantum capillus-veneris]
MAGPQIQKLAFPIRPQQQSQRLLLVLLLSLFCGISHGLCPYDLSGLQNFTSLCSGSSESVSSAQILICCEDIYGAAVFAMSRHANLTGEMFPPAEQAEECISAYKSALASSSQLLEEPQFFQHYCPLPSSRISAGASPCHFATTRDMARLLITELPAGIGAQLLHNVSHTCNQLGQIGQRGCQACQTQLLDAIARLVNMTGDQPAACGTAVAIAMTSLNPSAYAFQNFYQCVLEILNEFVNISAITAPKAVVPSTAVNAGERPLPVEESKRSSPKTVYVIVGVVSSLAVVAFLALIGLFVFRARDLDYHFPAGISGALLSTSESSETPAILPTEGFYIFHLKELTKATNSFSDSLMIGEGSAGAVYLGNLPSGKLVAVKRILKEKKVETFNKEVELLARIRHPNLTALLGYCQAKFVHLLVYEFMSNGDLGKKLLDPSSRPLTWDQRVKIAIDCAKGLTYLHEFPQGPIIHRDVKPSNILLNEALEAKLSDFGLSKVLEYEASHVSTEIKGTTGYLDPEYLILGQLTEASDVYGFGVVLLQLLSGRKAIDGDSLLNRSLVQLAFSVMSHDVALSELIDPRLEGVFNLRAFEKMAEVAYRCVQARSYDRPSISEVLDALEVAMRLTMSSAPPPAPP